MIGGRGYNSGQFDPTQIDYENERVQQIHNQLGSFNYNTSTPMGLNQNLEHRDMHTLENHAKFEGQWIHNSDVREGMGK